MGLQGKIGLLRLFARNILPSQIKDRLDIFIVMSA